MGRLKPLRLAVGEGTSYAAPVVSAVLAALRSYRPDLKPGQANGGGGVAYAAHVGGFIFGAVVARLFARGGGEPKWEWAR